MAEQQRFERRRVLRRHAERSLRDVDALLAELRQYAAELREQSTAAELAAAPDVGGSNDDTP